LDTKWRQIVPRKVNADTQEVIRKILKDGRGVRDVDFRDMACDEEYQSEALRIAEEFSASDAEAIDIAERDMSKP
jgi:hypothetical protein